MANKILVRAGAILREASCKTVSEFWRRMGREDFAKLFDVGYDLEVELRYAPVYLEALHLARANIPPSRNPRNVAFAKERTIRTAAKTRQRKEREPRKPTMYRAQKRTAAKAAKLVWRELQVRQTGPRSPLVKVLPA